MERVAANQRPQLSNESTCKQRKAINMLVLKLFGGNTEAIAFESAIIVRKCYTHYISVELDNAHEASIGLSVAGQSHQLGITYRFIVLFMQTTNISS